MGKKERMRQRLLQDQQQLLVKYKTRDMRIVMMDVLTMKIAEDGEEGEDETEVATGSATTPSQVQNQGYENSDDGCVDNEDSRRWGRRRG